MNYNEIQFSFREPAIGQTVVTIDAKGQKGIYERTEHGYNMKWQQGGDNNQALVTWLEEVEDTKITHASFGLYVEPMPLNSVSTFHKIFGHPILKDPTIPSEERCNLRIELLQEELNELKQAITDGNVVEVADALCDIQYVLSGAILEFGMGSRFANLFAEVQRSNMSKACESPERAQETVDHYAELGVETYFEEAIPDSCKFIVYRKSDNKIMKSKYYSKAELNLI